MNKVSVYYDTTLVQKHNPDFGNIECGDRVDVNTEYYKEKNIRVVPFKKSKSSNILLKNINSKNKIFQYLSNNNCLNWISKIFGKKNYKRNCHGCTTLIDSDECIVCNTQYKKSNYYTYASNIDKNIIDSDTTYITDTTYDAIVVSTNLILRMIKDVYNGNTKNGFAIVRPPGHHASYTKSEGFCIVNNIALCAEGALMLGFKKIFIFDFDAHHGNGTQEIFYHSSKVFYCSMHTLEFYPKTGTVDERGEGDGLGYNLNIIVQKGIDTLDYLNCFRKNVLPAIRNYQPDLILVSAGFDGLYTDPMKIMNLSGECYGVLTIELTQFNVPVCMILEGGYDVQNLSRCYSICIDKLNM